jgi:hypothetical protein
MMMSRDMTLCLLFLVVGVSASGGDLYVRCDPQHARARQNFEIQLRKAEPGTEGYVAHPFSTDPNEITENLVYQLEGLWRGTRNLDEPSRGLLELIDRGEAKFDVRTVQNWRPNVCRSPVLGDRLYLVIIFDSITGLERARAALGESGLLEQIGFPSGDEATVDSIESGVKRLRARGVNPTDSVFITSFGTLRCDILNPCLAARSGSRTFVLTPDGDVFHIENLSRRYRRSDKETDPRNSTHDRRIMSVGPDEYAVANRHRND